MSDLSLLATVAAKMDMHLEADKASFAAIDRTTTQILMAVQALGDKLDSSTRRVHDRLDVSNATASVNLNAVEGALNKRIDAEAESTRASSAATNDKITDQKVWILSTAAVGALGIIGFLVDLLVRTIHVH